MQDRAALGQQILGWSAIAMSTFFACIWAWWGSNENFHEGWYSPSFLRNVGLLLAQYLSPMLLVVSVSAAALRWRRLALPLLTAVAIAAVWFFGGFRIRFAALALIALPLALLGVLYRFGRPEPRRWAWRCLIGLPLATALVSGAYPAWRAAHRLDDGNYGMRQIAGNGLTLIWAPQGPGWPANGVSWDQATQRCAHLTANGLALSNQVQNLWRLPAVDEAVRSLVFRGSNAGGTWDSVKHQAHFRVVPDKDSPLWMVHSPVIYWWTSTEADPDHAYYISNNGYVHLAQKQIRPGYLAYRCVCEPAGLHTANGRGNR